MALGVQQQLLEILGKIDRPGTFCTSGRLPPTIPGLEVTGVGMVPLPLEKRLATALKKLARQAPYGKGTETLVDTNVRRVWEIDADQVTFANQEWSDVLRQAVDTVQAELGLSEQKLKPHLYKLLIYERGSFFLPHRDGEKRDRMVATLVIALPSAHEGGELVIRHEGREVIVDFAQASNFQTQFAAFYADCEHEVRPVTSGFRLAVVYNLTLENSKPTIAAPTSRQHITAVAQVLSEWRKSIPAVPEPSDRKTVSKLAVILDHQYSPAGLNGDTLKGIDRAQADILFQAGRDAGCDVSLALVTYWESGSAEPSGDYGYGRRYEYDRDNDDDDPDNEGGSEHVMGELFDYRLTAGEFSDEDGTPLAFGAIPLNEIEIVSKVPLDEGEPDQEEFEGYTGNAGMTLEHWYHRAAILIWPMESRFDVLCEAGENAAVAGLDRMIRQWKQAEPSKQFELKRSCLEFASRIIARWPERKVSYRGYAFPSYESDIEEQTQGIGSEADESGVNGRKERQNGVSIQNAPRPFLSLINDLGDVSLIAAWIRGVLVKDISVVPGTTLGDLCEHYGWATFQVELLELFERTSNETLERDVRLLADWCLRKTSNDERTRLCSRLAQQVVSTVELWNPRPTNREWQTRIVDLPELLIPLTQIALSIVDGKLLERLVTYILDRSKELDLTIVQVPVLLRLAPWLKQHVTQTSSELQRWFAAIADELTSREARPPQEPSDWHRDAATGCKCNDCKQLIRFLADAKTKSVRFPLAENRRKHLHQIIDERQLETTHVTERSGRPYTLVCTKTQASYVRALQAYRVDVDHLLHIRSLMEWHEGLSVKLNELVDTVPKAAKPAKKRK